MHSDQDIQGQGAEHGDYRDAVYELPERALDLAWLRRYLPLQYAGCRALELGCGSGYWTQYLAPLASRYLALDPSPAALERAKLRPGVERVAFRAGGAEALPADERFDAVFAGLYFSHVPKQHRDELLARLHGGLSGGARVIFIDNSELQCREYPLVAYDDAGNGYQQRPTGDGGQRRVLKNFPNETELRLLLGRHGVGEMAFLRREHFWLLEYRLPDWH
ncbi:class I SAM-dependent methyltransferase [Chromobacterium vaccinii]|uniref:class I SAM-dependent methyltransferase n=1 Tax=Chromobacterium vaccinii TaxID=1108595 RepID=UPI003C721106